MILRKDDPDYYTNKISKLIKQAREAGLEIKAVASGCIEIYFRASNGDTAGIRLKED